MCRNDLMTVEKINALSNATLKESLNIMINAIQTSTDNNWIVAYHVWKTITGEMFKDDFKDYKTYSEFLGLSKGTISQMKKAVEFAKNRLFLIVNDDGTLETPMFAVSIAYLMSTVDYEEFCKWLYGQGIDFRFMSQRELKNAIQEFKDSTAIESTATEIDTTEKTTEETTEETETNKDLLAIDTTEKAITAIALLVKKFDITLDMIVENCEFNK